MWGGVSCGCGSSRGYNKEKALLLFKEQAMIASSFFGAGGGGFLPKDFSYLWAKMMSSSPHRRLAKVYFPDFDARLKDRFRFERRRDHDDVFFFGEEGFASTDMGGEKKDDWSSLPQNAHNRRRVREFDRKRDGSVENIRRRIGKF